jgi:hypothetical protein
MVEDDGGPSSVMGPGGMLGEGIAEPLAADWALDDDGNFIDLALGQTLPGTPAVAQGATMPSDAGASARVRQQHEEDQRAGAEVSFAAVYYPYRHSLLLYLSLCSRFFIELTFCASLDIDSPFTATW